MTNSSHPCSNGLSPACFASYPQWAHKVFAWRLFCTIAPPPVSRALQRILGITGAFPGVELPPGLVLPPGTIIPPGAQLPDAWQPGDPLPTGVWHPTITWEFPPGWSPGDPPPPGVIIPHGTFFPEGWRLGDPLPAEVVLPAGFYYVHYITPDNVLPPGTSIRYDTVFPTGWKYGDPLPDGVTLPTGFDYSLPWSTDFSLPYFFDIDPGTVFPTGWKYGDPLPSGVWLPSGTIYGYPQLAAPPSIIAPWESGRPFPVGGIVPPPSGDWVYHYDDSAWETDPSYPRPSLWLSEYNAWYLPQGLGQMLVVGSWANDYRPTKFRLLVVDVTGEVYVRLSSIGGDYTICEKVGYTTLEELTLDFSENLDIVQLNITGTGLVFSAMEFYEK